MTGQGEVPVNHKVSSGLYNVNVHSTRVTATVEKMQKTRNNYWLCSPNQEARFNYITICFLTECKAGHLQH